MDFLQTIWTSITMENANLVSAISIPLAFLEAYIFMLLFTTIFDIRADKKQQIFYVVILSVFSLISRFFIPNPYGTFINILFVPICIYFIFKTTVLKSIFCTIIPFITVIFIETILSKIYFLIFNVEYFISINIPIQRLILSLIIYGIVLMFYFLIKYFKVNLSKLDILDKKRKFSLTFSAFFGIILIATQLYIAFFYQLPIGIIIVNLLTLFIYFASSMYTIFTVAKLEITSTSLEEAQLHNKTLQIFQDNMRAFKHDFGNIMQGISGYIDKNDMPGLKIYYDSLEKDCQRTNNLTALSPEVVNNPAVYNVLANKYHKADEKGIEINLEVFLDLNQLNMSIYEFTRILGILMDNAIEATKECDNKIINVILRKDSRKNMQLLSIENTYKDKDIDTEKIYEKGFSTKKGNSGLGLWEVRQILKKHNNLNLYTTKNNVYFKQDFEIYF